MSIQDRNNVVIRLNPNVNQSKEVGFKSRAGSSPSLEQLTERVKIDDKQLSLWRTPEGPNLNIDGPDGRTNVYRVNPGTEDKLLKALNSGNQNFLKRLANGDQGISSDFKKLEYLFSYATDNNGPVTYGGKRVGFSRNGEQFITVGTGGERLGRPQKGAFSGDQIFSLFNGGQKPFGSRSIEVSSPNDSFSGTEIVTNGDSIITIQNGNKSEYYSTGDQGGGLFPKEYFGNQPDYTDPNFIQPPTIKVGFGNQNFGIGFSFNI